VYLGFFNKHGWIYCRRKKNSTLCKHRFPCSTLTHSTNEDLLNIKRKGYLWHPRVRFKSYLTRTSLVRYDLNLTLGCHRFYYLAPLPVLDPIYLALVQDKKITCVLPANACFANRITADRTKMPRNKIKQDFHFTTLKRFKIIKLTNLW
jgi:hypothetical protein